ncbi:MAG: hydantoinase/oxoprolinase family protein, partial [Deltaproteobacteria bacterium]|nr:hydantoinase/oxoprolinase family protein [Deltaproteobacteria bacterium]
LLVDEDGRHDIFKSLSTPKNPSIGVVNGLTEIARYVDLAYEAFLSKVQIIVHGTTITTNAVLTRNGAKTAFITTKGFRDVLNMRRGLRDRQYDSRYDPPEPLVRRRDIFTVTERVDQDGNIALPVDEAEMQAIIKRMQREDYEAIGASTIFSYINTDNEKKIGELLREAFPDTYISLSSEILPQVRVYERNSTVALNAYVGPILSGYLQRAESGLNQSGFNGLLLIMQSNGGVMSPEMSSRFAVNTLLSGPAGGPVAGQFVSSIHGLDNIITVDMGGTSFDVCLIKDGRPTITTEGEIGGYRMALPTLYIETIGAGGGSIASVDAAGMLQVGPQSAGADPGPVCYGKGGREPTVTDADLILGYLSPDYFHGGALILDKKAAEKAIEDRIANKLGLSVTEAAAGIYKMININMAMGVSMVSVSKGHNPMKFAMVVAGGAGPIHAAQIAKDQEMPLIIVPRGSSVFCASGMLMSDLKHDYVHTYTAEFKHLDTNRVKSICDDLLKEAISTLATEGIPEERVQAGFTSDIRYLGQFNEVNVALPMSSSGEIRDEDMASLAELFHKTHDNLYGYSMPGAELELINIRLQAIGETVKPAFKDSPRYPPDASSALKNKRQVYFEDQFIETPVYDGLVLKHGNLVFGPAIVEEPTTTIVVPPDFDLICDSYNNYVLYRKSEKLEEIIAKLKESIQ